MLCLKIFKKSIKVFTQECNSLFIIDKRFCSSNKSRNPYEVLGLKNTCSTKDVKKAYIKLCKEFHPDKKPDDASQHRKFVELNNAYSILIDDTSRKKFDEFGSEPPFTNVNEDFHYNAHSGTSNPFDKTHIHEKPRYDKDTYNEEYAEYLRAQKRNAHVTFQAKKSYILHGCFALLVIGYAMYYAAYRYAKYYKLTTIDEKSKKISESYNATVKAALLNGTEKTLERLKRGRHQSDRSDM